MFDCNGKPLEVGDKIIMVKAHKPFNRKYNGTLTKVVDIVDYFSELAIVTDIPNPRGLGFSTFICHGDQVKKVDNGSDTRIMSFHELMNNLKKQPAEV
ncbi:MAG: hypothetical protein GOVbin1096_120 [Prokaryotic dsDNA virus sp.]|jgi:hypothetical protein|nr:MAG: hypothetical protein GOVbin1096_120 [Prokaryotic dsDNA virus sp.]|tara:strand:- start:30141 stop:30434 length:294 start_codon:yes stop_codon:yes gene_type:complete